VLPVRKPLLLSDNWRYSEKRNTIRSFPQDKGESPEHHRRRVKKAPLLESRNAQVALGSNTEPLRGVRVGVLGGCAVGRVEYRASLSFTPAHFHSSAHLHNQRSKSHQASRKSSSYASLKVMV
jgi:hypothetical protein